VKPGGEEKETRKSCPPSIRPSFEEGGKKERGGGKRNLALTPPSGEPVCLIPSYNRFFCSKNLKSHHATRRQGRNQTSSVDGERRVVGRGGKKKKKKHNFTFVKVFFRQRENGEKMPSYILFVPLGDQGKKKKKGGSTLRRPGLRRGNTLFENPLPMGMGREVREGLV